MRLSVFSILIVVFCTLTSCSSNGQEVNVQHNYDTIIGKQYIYGLKEQYKHCRIEVDSQITRPIDFIAMYLTACEHDTLGLNKRYAIVYICNAYGIVKGEEENLFYSELICFKDGAMMDSIIGRIKRNNCIDPYNLKLHRVYKIGEYTALFLNFHPTFDVPTFEVFLSKELKHSLEIDVINNYQ